MMQSKDIPDLCVVALARRWREGMGNHPGVVQALVEEFGVPEKLALVKVLSLCGPRKRLLDYGTSPYYAWPAT